MYCMPTNVLCLWVYTVQYMRNSNMLYLPVLEIGMCTIYVAEVRQVRQRNRLCAVVSVVSYRPQYVNIVEVSQATRA